MVVSRIAKTCLEASDFNLMMLENLTSSVCNQSRQKGQASNPHPHTHPNFHQKGQQWLYLLHRRLRWQQWRQSTADFALVSRESFIATRLVFVEHSEIFKAMLSNYMLATFNNKSYQEYEGLTVASEEVHWFRRIDSKGRDAPCTSGPILPFTTIKSVTSVFDGYYADVSLKWIYAPKNEEEQENSAQTEGASSAKYHSKGGAEPSESTRSTSMVTL